MSKIARFFAPLALVAVLGPLVCGVALAQDEAVQDEAVQDEAVREEAVQDAASPETALPAAGTVGFYVDGDRRANVGFVQRGDGPRVSLAPIAQALGVELRIGPLGDSHTLVFDEERIVVGPDSPSFVTISADGTLRDELTRLSSAPMKTPSGLKVSIDFLEKAFGDRLGLEFDWRPAEARFEARRRTLRAIDTAVDVVHQYRVSTVEIRLSERPRWRFERLDGAVVVRFVGDRLVSAEVPTVDDPLIDSVEIGERQILIDLRENATATEPRLVGDAPVRLVVDVYRSRAPRADELEPAEEAEVPSARGLRTIVLDPGHGGSETGAIGRSGTVESEQTLRVARMLASALRRRMPVRVVLTREEDVDVPHATRVAIANQNKADLFISLHFNSYYGSAARGAETYFLSREASDRVAAAVAERENAAPVGAGDAGLADLELILWDLAQSHHLAESQRFANLVQEELNQALGLRDRGVRQAPFRVLMGADMPAVLVELGFLSNPDEEARLQEAEYLNQLVEALVRAVRRFRVQAEALSAASSVDDPSIEDPSTEEEPTIDDAAGATGGRE